MNSHGAENLAGIVLAAGRSRRFGGDKRYAVYDTNDTLLTKSIALVEPHLKHLIVATRPDDAGQEEALLGAWFNHPRVEQYAASSSHKGMGNTLADAVARLCEIERQCGRQFTGVLVMLADMPRVRSTTISAVVAAAAVDKIVRPCYQSDTGLQFGHPVLFGRLWFDALQALEGDSGGRSIIKKNAWARLDIRVDDAGILLDVDTPADVKALYP